MASRTEERPGVLNKNQYRELAEPDDPDAEPPCPSAKVAIIVFGKGTGRTVTVCLDERCPVYTNHTQSADEEIEPPPVMPDASEEENGFLEEVAAHFASDDENAQQSDDEIVLAALSTTADDKLTGIVLRIVLSDHVGIPQGNAPALLTDAESVFALKKPKVVKPKKVATKQPNAAPARSMPA